METKMTLLETIRADALSARKAKSPVASVLVTLIGEIDTKTKTFSPARAMRDDEVVATVKKFIKNIDDTLRVIAAGEAADKLAQERQALEAYMPAQMSPEALRAFASAKAGEGMNLGQIMAALKAEYAGQYDGKLASGIVREVAA